MVLCRSRVGWCNVMLQHPSEIPNVDKGLPNVPGLLFLRSRPSRLLLPCAVQCLDHRKFVGPWVVGHKVEVAVCVGGFPVYSCRDGAIWASLEEDIQKRELAVRLQLNCDLYAGFHPIEVVQELLHT